MTRSTGKLLLFFSLVTIVSACSPERTISKAFYYWKSNVVLGDAEQKALTDLQVKKLYVKFFDVSWDPRLQRPAPAARVVFSQSSLDYIKKSGLEIIPTVFITNETLDNIAAETATKLAERIDFLLRDLLSTNSITSIKEVQIDCDWTEKTRDKYFTLLQYLKTLPLYLNKELSATIRLYQCKFQSKTGVPPVNKGLLMCYNMGNLKHSATQNSILDPEELRKYTDNLDAYPLALDLALPLFGWKVLFRDNVYSGLIQNLPDSLLVDSSLSIIKGNQTEILKDTMIHGYELHKGDRLRQETSDIKDLVEAAKIISPKLRAPNICVSLFHLDSTTLSKFKTNELENIFHSFHR